MISAAELFDRLLATYGPQHWWPADDEFEIMAGALLVQRTAWSNAAAAIANLRSCDLLSAAAIHAADVHDIERLIRPAGFFRSKAARLKHLAAFLTARMDLDRLRSADTGMLRERLLGLDGVGPETADAILLYAFGRPAVVVDEYLRRLAGRLIAAPGRIGDPAIRAWVGRDRFDVAQLNELHALVVEHGKQVCGSRPRCAACRLRPDCLTGRSASDAELGQGVGDVAQNA